MMELEIAFGHRQQNRMEEQDRTSQSSSVVTVSSTKDNKLQSFCKRSGSVQRDPNCAVVIRGWLYKRDSTWLKLWKKRWFVLSNYCLFYYKDSREECVLGSLPLPSYKIFFCSPRECKNRKYAFKVVHTGMRSYFLSAGTQEDMLGWVRALRQSACMETDDITNRLCSSYQDFSQLGGSTESVNPLYAYRSHNKLSYASGNVDMKYHRDRHSATRSSDSQTRSVSLDCTGVDQVRFHSSVPSTPRSHYESRPHSPVCSGDLRPQWDKETHTLTALQGDTDMVLTCLCGCDKVLQTLSVEMDLLQHDKDHAEFVLDMSRLDLNKEHLSEQDISQKCLLQEELISIRARMCDISQEMEKVWMDYKRMESELCVFRSHLQHICQFGLLQERFQAQKQVWMMDDILSGLKSNRRRFKALMFLHTPKLFPFLHNSSLHPEERLHYWGEELEPPARPPLPLEIKSTNMSRKLRSEGVELSNSTLQRSQQKQMQNKRSRSSDSYTNIYTGSKSESSPVCLTHVMRAELPTALTAQRVCVEESNPKEDTPNTMSYKHEEWTHKDNVCAVNREHTKHTKLRRVKPVRKSALRRSDSAHPLKFIDFEISGEKSTESLGSDGVCIHGNMGTETETSLSLCDFTPSLANQISMLTINNIVSEEADQSVSLSTSTNQRTEWFLSTNHWQGFIPLNIQEEELLPANQDSDTATNQDSNQTHLKEKLSTTTSFVTMETPDKITPKPTDSLAHQPIGASSDSHMVFHSDHSGRELCIYEEIHCKAAEDDGSVVHGAKGHHANASLTDEGGVNGDTIEEVEEETGSDLMISGKTAQPRYSCLSKNSVTSDSFLKPRVTVVSTSL